MKRILLASASVVAFAGAASAEITFTGSLDLGYNDDVVDGFFSDLDVTLGFAVELDNGLTAAASIDLDDFIESDGSEFGEDYELSLTSSMGGLFFGDTNFAAQNIWISAGDMEAPDFSEADGETALRGEVTYGNVSAQLSYALANANGRRNDANQDGDTLEQLSLGVSADFGNYNIVVAYQEEVSDATVGGRYVFRNSDFTDQEIFGISVGTTFGGADVRLAYADNSTLDHDSIGVQVSYPFGPVTATVYYVAESGGLGDDDNWGVTLAYSEGPLAVTLDYDDDQGVDDWGLEGSYDVGNGLVVYAGIDDSGDDYYVAGEYDLGSGASLLVSWAEDEDDAGNDEIGAQDYNDGTTIELSFEF